MQIIAAVMLQSDVTLAKQGGECTSSQKFEEVTMANVCKFNRGGFCKFKDNCRYRHINEICEDEDCDVNSCE